MSVRWHWLAITLPFIGPLIGLRVSAANTDKDFRISDNVDLVLLDVSVKYPAGSFVKGLARSDFRVCEDGRPREITHFANLDVPVSVGLVLDNSGSMRAKRPELAAAGLAFAKFSNPRDEFFVVNFNNRIYYGLPRTLNFTDNIELLRNALYYGQPQGQTALYDAVASALHHLELSDRTLRTLIVVSDGGDNVSAVRYKRLMELIEASRSTIYTIGLLDPDDRDLKPGVLRKFASVSGGEYFQAAKLNEMTAIFAKISQDLRSRYTLGFAPDEVNNKRTLRTVKVSVRAKGRKLNVRTRSSYSIVPLRELLSEDDRESIPEVLK